MTVTTVGKDVYHALRDAIVSGQFHPNERLVESSIAAMLGAGRTAVRAALVRLDQEGLVTLEPNRGARVRLIPDREALEIEEVRATLEVMLARRAATHASAAALHALGQVLLEMRRLVAQDDSLGYSELNSRFHQLIWSAADNPTAAGLVGSLKSQSIRFQYRTILRPARTERSLHEHEEIFAALSAGDAEAAEVAMREHLAAVLDTLRWAIESQRRSATWLSSLQPD
ncbi:MAG: GntR family transcriptional regulator [Candidatus Dormibacterales bacterium]